MQIQIPQEGGRGGGAQQQLKNLQLQQQRAPRTKRDKYTNAI